MRILRQSSSITIKIGRFVDESDGVTAETGLTISQGDVRLSKNGGDFAQKNDSNACTHDEYGFYNCALNTTDTNTAGRLLVAVYESGAIPVQHEFMVMPQAEYDALFSTDRLQVDVREVSGDSTAADNLEADYDGNGYNKSASTIGTVTAVAEAGRESLAETILTYDWTEISSWAERSLLQAARRLRNRVAVSGGTMTVYRENDSTTGWTAAVTTDSEADPVTQVDPN